MPDEQIECADCRAPFIFTEGEQKFFEKKGFRRPKRCPACREAKKARVGGPGEVKGR